MTPRDARDAALEALLQMERRGAWSDGSLKRIAAQSGLEARDAALCTRLTYGVVQNRTLLDYYIDHWCTQKAARLEPVVACLLRLGIYQILFMDKVPDRAAVHETVELTKRRGKARAAGMINAVLRKCASSKNTLPPLPQNSFISKAAVQYSHPRWLVERLTALVGEQEAEAFLRLDNEPVPTVIQANPLKTTPAELENELRSDGVRLTPHPWLEGCFEVTGTGDLERLSAFASGRCTVQDAAARLAAIAAGPKPGDRVLDVCAAPGGKSFAMAMQMENRGDIFSCDIHPHKLKLIENGAARLGITIIRTALAEQGVDFPCEVDVLVTGDAGIHTINLEMRGVDRPTDVLSFPEFELTPGELPGAEDADPGTGYVPLGDMVISLERVKAQAKEYGHANRRELAYLAVHSVLHLLGYDHLDEGPMKAQMREREEAIMSVLGLERK